MSIRSFAIAAGAAVSAFAVSAPAHAEWLEAKSKHFTVYGDMKEADLKARTIELEKFDAVLRGIFNVKTDDSATIYYANSLGELQQLAGSSQVAGFYRADAQGAIGFIPEKLPNMPNFVGSSMTPERIMFHEYTHHMLLSNSGKYFPAWATEGLAELFMTATFDAKGNVVIGAPNASRTYAIGSMTRWSVRKLIENGVYPPKGEERIELYSRGWALCHYLLISGKRPGQFFKYVDAINAGVPSLKAGEDAFGDLDKLDQEVERYIRQAKFPSSLFSAERIKAPTEVTTRRLTEGENAIFGYRMVSANGVGPKTAGPLAEKARPVAARFTSDAFVQRAIAEMEYDAKNWDAANAAADRALAIDPRNIMAMAYKGRVAMQKAVANKNDPAQLKEARRWFLAANKLDPNFALPFQLYYDSFVAVGAAPPAGAISGIGRAAYLVPADMGLRVRAGIAAIRANDIKLARFTLAPFAFNPHGSADSPVAKLVKEIDSGANQEALLKKAAELKLDRFNEFSQPNLDSKDGDKT